MIIQIPVKNVGNGCDISIGYPNDELLNQKSKVTFSSISLTRTDSWKWVNIYPPLGNPVWLSRNTGFHIYNAIIRIKL